MSLRVWLPLTKDLRNQGLDDVSIITTNASFIDTGKLGHCLKLGYTNDFNIPSMINKKQISLAYWVKVNTATATDWLDAIHFYTSDGTSSVCNRQEFFTNCSASGFFYDGGDSSGIEYGAIVIGEWYHFTTTVDYATGEIKTYRNGDLLRTKYNADVNAHITGNFRLGESGLDISMNDVRIYDHCLSPMEVKELSKGLACHYPLDGKNNSLVPFGYQQLEYIESTGDSYFNTNCYFNPEIDSCKVDFQGTDTQNNGMILANSSVPYFWLYYYRAGSRITIYADNGSGQENTGDSISQDLNRHIVEYKNKDYYVDGNKCGSLTKTYTRNTAGTLWLFSYGGNSYVFKGKIYYVNIVKNGKIERVFIPAKRNSDSVIGMYDLVYNTFYSSESSTAFIAGPIVSSPTTIYDTSGYCNNGTINGSLTISTDTPKYQASIYMPKAALITHPRPVFGGTDQEWTCAMWVKLDNTSQGSQAMNNFNISNNIVHASNSTPLLYLNDGTNDYYNYGNKAVSAGVWTHIAFVFKNSNATKLIYINGVEQTNKNGPNKTSTPRGIADIITVGTNLAGYISDYRVYATALSANDVKSLYQNSAYIDSSGNVYGAVHSEV